MADELEKYLASSCLLAGGVLQGVVTSNTLPSVYSVVLLLCVGLKVRLTLSLVFYNKWVSGMLGNLDKLPFIS